MIRFLAIAIFAMLTCAPVAAGADELPEKTQRQDCGTSEECTFAVTPCGTKEAVNVKYQVLLQKKFDSGMDIDECPWQDERVVKSSYCLAGRCHIDLRPKPD